jgi:hypothetical protein
MPVRYFYDPVAHTYSCNNTPWPSVTQALDRGGYINKRFYTGNGLERGRRVHALTMAVDTKALVKEATIPEDCGGPFEAYQMFVRDKRPSWEYIEKAFYHRTLRYGGRPDRVFRRITGIEGPGTLEIKTGGFADWHGYQTAGYVRLRPRGCRLVLYLGDDGRYRLILCRDMDDHRVFLAALRETWNTWPTNR